MAKSNMPLNFVMLKERCGCSKSSLKAAATLLQFILVLCCSPLKQLHFNKIYPPSKIRTLGAAIVMTAGGFIVAAAVGGIIEMYAQDWWKRFLEWLARG